VEVTLVGITERIDAITALGPERRSTTLPAPKSVKIELTGRCNFACVFCARSQRLREQMDMDRALFERLLIEMRGAGVEEIGLFYLGESFLVPWLEEAVRFAKQEAGYDYVFLTTNGSLAEPVRVRALMEAGLDSLKFSLNYADAAQFTEIARVKGQLFETVIENVKAARPIRAEVEEKTGRACGLYGSYIAYDGEQGARMADLVTALTPYLDEIYALPLYNQADLVGEDMAARGFTVTAGNRGRLGALRDSLPCWSLFTEGHVSWHGKLVGCCFAHTDDFEFGDLTEQSFMTAWNSPRAQWLRDANLNEDVRGTPCEDCVAYA
jgi:MoaA/NifB/PqqE/SkfB family radical SAM enzyme